MGTGILTYYINYIFYLIIFSILYYLSVRNVFLKNKELKTINSLGITFLTIVIIIVLKFIIETHILKIEWFEPIYLEVLVIITALIIYIIKKIRIEK